jgi:hypothetical protein
MDDAEDATADDLKAGDGSGFRWRPWPCESCSGGATPLDHLVRSFGSSPEVPNLGRNAEELGRNEVIDWFKHREAERLLDWVRGCEHTSWLEMHLPELARGSEHLVLFESETSEVVKVTLPGTYGDYYEIIDGRIYQFDSTPAEYLLRMHWWEKLFSTAPNPIGLTEDGRILSRQKFIVGDPPTQELVDTFLSEAGAEPVRQPCWLWKKVDPDSETEVWIGDARSDNFVLAREGMIPIDIRIWGIPIN